MRSNLNFSQSYKIFKKVTFQNIIDLHAKVNTIQVIWDKFEEIFNKIKQNMLTSEKVKTLTSDWLKQFLEVYQKSSVTPYMHVFVAHLHQFVHL